MKSRLAITLLVLPACLLALLAWIQSGTSADPTRARPGPSECRWTDEPLTLDGKADEAAWKAADLISSFGQPWNSSAAPARVATRARLLWDREYLWFFADMEDLDLAAGDTAPEASAGKEDLFEVYLKPAADKAGYFVFRVNAAGKSVAAFIPQRKVEKTDRLENDAEIGLQVAVQRRGTLNQPKDRDSGWSVEGRVAWRDLLHAGGRPGIDEQWSFALCRTDVSAGSDGPEFSSSAPLSKRDFHRHEDYSSLRFVGPAATQGVRQAGVAKRIPLTASRVVGSPEPPAPYAVKRAFPKLKITNPIGVAREPDSDRLLLIHQASAWGGKGRIVRIKDDPNVTEAEEFLDIDGIAYGVAFHPDFAKNGYIFVGWSGPHEGDAKLKKTLVTRYTMDRKAPYKIIPGSKKEIISWPSNGHNGGDVAFGLDGMLYVTSGDGTSDSDTNLTGQDLTQLLAKLLRIDVDHPDPGKAYSVPKDNPFVGREGTVPETWAYGFRNPWRITVDRKTGDVWVGQNGQDTWEQAFLIKKGANYGWSVMEGSHPFYLNRKRGPEPLEPPTVEHSHAEFRSLTGGIVCYADRLPELHGTYLYGDFSTGKIWGARVKDGKLTWNQELVDTTLQVTGFGTDSKGEVLIADHGGNAYYYLEKAPPRDPKAMPAFPRKLSETGLFRSVKGHEMEPALIPYSVNAQLWSDGAHKVRYIALPGADSRIELTATRGWNFPDLTVIVKSFALETVEGDPSSRRWIETRLLTKQEGEWVGYSYLWNDEQTDAVLVEAKGADRDCTIRTGKGADEVRKQTWHYPSRTECMVCHTRASNYVLGLTTLQMNKVHDYGGAKDNQLRTLEHLGILRTDWTAEARTALKEEATKKGMTEKQANEWLEKRTAARQQREPAKSVLLATAPEKYPHLVDPLDPKQDLEARARSYLHANCAICHVEAGGGNAMMELEFSTPRSKMRTVDVKPNHHTFDFKDARLVAPGVPERSTLLHRVTIRGQNQMPPLATSRVDADAVKLLEEWIRQLKP